MRDIGKAFAGKAMVRDRNDPVMDAEYITSFSDQKILKKDYSLTCPVCGETRAVSKAIHRRFLAGGTKGACRSCACVARNKARPVKIIERASIECCGCKLYEDKRGGRCERFFDCANNYECLGIVARKVKMWAGFSADCRGFRKKEVGY